MSGFTRASRDDHGTIRLRGRQEGLTAAAAAEAVRAVKNLSAHRRACPLPLLLLVRNLPARRGRSALRPATMPFRPRVDGASRLVCRSLVLPTTPARRRAIG